MDFEIPDNFIAEITVIGTGGGYGESCVVHIGNQKWIVIDSCIDPFHKKSLPLQYLEDIGVDVSSKVILIICTHWDDDHILGISQLLEKCTNSKFSFAKAVDRVKFLRMVSLDYQKVIKESTISSTREFNKCLEILEQRRTNPLVSYSDKTLLTLSFENYLNQIIALSPSDAAMAQFDLEISTLITEFGKSNRRIVPFSPNLNSIAIFMKLGCHRAILGADLEVSQNSDIGWSDIVKNSQTIDQKATFFKVPHHGSKNGYYEQLWNEKLTNDVKAALTPWNRGYKLPTLEMKDFYKRKAQELFITSNFNKGKPKKRDSIINKMIQDFKIELEEVPFRHGIIRARINMLDNDDSWNIECYGSASKA